MERTRWATSVAQRPGAPFSCFCSFTLFKIKYSCFLYTQFYSPYFVEQNILLKISCGDVVKNCQVTSCCSCKCRTDWKRTGTKWQINFLNLFFTKPHVYTKCTCVYVKFNNNSEYFLLDLTVMTHMSIIGIKWIVHNSYLKMPRVEQVVYSSWHNRNFIWCIFFSGRVVFPILLWCCSEITNLDSSLPITYKHYKTLCEAGYRVLQNLEN